MYRARFEESKDGDWTMEGLVQRDRFVELQEGDIVTVEAPAPGGVLLFQSTVLDVQGPATATIAKPKWSSFLDRREVRRRQYEPALAVTVDGAPAEVVDLSLHGARVVTEKPLRRGERIHVDLARLGRVGAWVLSSDVAGTRLRFETPLRSLDVVG